MFESASVTLNMFEFIYSGRKHWRKLSTKAFKKLWTGKTNHHDNRLCVYVYYMYHFFMETILL